MLNEVFSSGNMELLITVLQFLRKADKMTLYGLLTMPSSYQIEQEICGMVQGIAGKLNDFDEILSMSGLDERVRVEVEKYLAGVI